MNTQIKCPYASICGAQKNKRIDSDSDILPSRKSKPMTALPKNKSIIKAMDPEPINVAAQFQYVNVHLIYSDNKRLGSGYDPSTQKD